MLNIKFGFRILAISLLAAVVLAIPGEAFAAKGGNGGGGGGGKPGGGGGEDPPPDPAILYQGGKGGHIMKMNADGSNQEVVLRNPPAYSPEPSWAPDGSQFVLNADYADGTGIYTAPIGGGDPTFIASTESIYVSGPDWGPAPAPDGNIWIAFNDSVPREANRDIFLVSPDGQHRIRLTDTPDVSETYPTFSHDGTHVGVVAGHYNEDQTAWVRDVWIYELEFVDGQLRAKPPISLTDQPGNPLLVTEGMSFADCSKTGDRILVSANLPGDDRSHDIWLIDFTDPGSITYTNLTANEANDSFRQATWSPDDSEIAYWRSGAGVNGVWVMNADGTNHRELIKRYGKAPDWKH